MFKVGGEGEMGMREGGIGRGALAGRERKRGGMGERERRVGECERGTVGGGGGSGS